MRESFILKYHNETRTHLKRFQVSSVTFELIMSYFRAVFIFMNPA